MGTPSDTSRASMREQLFVLPVQAWDRIWFEPLGSRQLNITRLAIGLVIAIWFLSFFSGLSDWFGREGILNSTTAAQIIDFEDTRPVWHWSPLWLTNAIWVYQSWIICGAVLAIAVAFGYGGRFAIVALLIFQAGWIHRILWLQGAFEPLSICLVLSLLISQPSKCMSLFEPHLSSTPDCATAWNRISLRLIQIHLWLFLMAGLLFQVSVEAWWQGEAAWWLAAHQRSLLLSMEQLRSNGLLINLLTHAVIVLEFATLLLITRSSTRTLGLLSGIVLFILVAIVWNQILLALLYAAALSAYRPSSNLQSSPV